jgi:hypothetical protein
MFVRFSNQTNRHHLFASGDDLSGAGYGIAGIGALPEDSALPNWNIQRTFWTKGRSWRHDGAMSESAKFSGIRILDRINLRLSADTFHAIDAARSKRAGRVSRNTWIAVAIEEKLAREGAEEASNHIKRAANA